MYVAKERGRARVELFDVALRARPLDRLDIEAALHHAVERDEFFVLLQPIVDLSSGDLVAVEALVRWAHPTRGLLAPEDFLDAAEETGVVVAMGTRVLDLACLATRQLAARVGHLPVLMVNVSARQLDQGDLPNLVRRTLGRHGMAFEDLCLEVTEGVIASAEATVGVLLELRSMGIGLAVDDFGTGYSSLSHLRRLPVGTLKIDKSFVRALGGDDGATQIVAAITHMARALGMTVVAEGVETHEQLAELQALGCRAGRATSSAAPARRTRSPPGGPRQAPGLRRRRAHSPSPPTDTRAIPNPAAERQPPDEPASSSGAAAVSSPETSSSFLRVVVVTDDVAAAGAVVVVVASPAGAGARVVVAAEPPVATGPPVVVGGAGLVVGGGGLASEGYVAHPDPGPGHSRRHGRPRPAGHRPDRHRQDRRLRPADPAPPGRRTASPRPRRGCRVLVLSPTRELATQIAESFKTYGAHLGMTVAVVFGGVKYGAADQARWPPASTCWSPPRAA